MVIEIQPDYVKLDKSLVSQSNTPFGAATMRKIAELGADSNFQVIAECIELAEMRDHLRSCGVRFMQDYFFARPAQAMTTRQDDCPVI
jgi:EAL domain-containing protein (putative c-di-GMP-specific phosphodiesterase class I)